MNDARKAYLAELDIQPYRLRSNPGPVASGHTASPPSASPAAAQPEVTVPAVSPVTREVALLDWAALRGAVAACTACGLCRTRTQTVFGVGNAQAEWMFIGEAPGAEEDRQGEPFVGRAGQLLNSMIQALGFKRSEVFIANILRCRPPGNRDPAPEEVAACAPFLARTIALVKPRIIVAVGRIAAQNLLRTDTPIGRMRGRAYEYEYGEGRIPVVVTYHPAYLLRSPGEKRKAWTDLKFARDILRRGAA